MSLKIAICDDEAVFADQAAALCKKTLNDLLGEDTEAKIDVFTTGNALAQKYLDGETYDVAFLDIIMDELDGMTLASIIKAKDEKTSIIFITSTEQYAVKGYRVKALRYILKPISENDMREILSYILKGYHKKEALVLKTCTGMRKVKIDKILYMEIMGRKTAVYTDEGKYVYNGKIQDFCEKLDNGIFFRCHQSYVINLKRVFEIKRFQAVLDDERVVPVSRQYWDEFKAAFLKNF